MKVTIKTIPHSKQRYETVGDWITKRGKLSEILVSDMKNDDYAFLVGLHEFIEAYLSLKNGITQAEADKFDMDYEDHRGPEDTTEPGDSPDAPYGKYHRFATIIEQRVAEELGVGWKKYSDTVNNL